MTLVDVREFFMWAAVLNFGLLILSVLIQFGLRPYLSALMNFVFKVDGTQSQEIICKAIVFQKIVTYVFFIVPFLALWVMTH